MDFCRVLLWLHHLYEKGQHPVLSQPVMVNLQVSCPTPRPTPGLLSQDTQADAHMCDPKSNPKCDHPDSDATLAKICLMVVLKNKK